MVLMANAFDKVKEHPTDGDDMYGVGFDEDGRGFLIRKDKKKKSEPVKEEKVEKRQTKKRG